MASLLLFSTTTPATAKKAAEAGKGAKSGKGAKLKTLSKEELFAKLAPATVLIVIPQRDGFSIGSGAIVDGSGLVVTNAHVVAASSGTVQVYMYNPKERTLETSLRDYVKNHSPLIGRVTKRGKDIDLALVRLPELVNSYPTIPLGDSDGLRIGQDVVAIGNPHGLTWTFTSGTISAIRKDALQTETPINPGNSGGPLLDMRGQVVGINTFIRKESQGLGFAIPVNAVKEFVEKFGKNTEVESPPVAAGPSLSKNPVPLASLSLSQDIERLRALNGRRQNRQAEGLLARDLEVADQLRQRMVRGELTVAQMLPQMLEQLKLMAVHNKATEEPGETTAAFHQQLEKTAEHLKQIFQVSQ
ncbi:MAG: trypsin-like peptidase domain-containing protein [Myxococcales bacterium]|nr:trypsin-like peptidase domain-containing protein [Myxococcales bacterium]